MLQFYYEIVVRKVTEYPPIGFDNTTDVFRIQVNIMFEEVMLNAVKISFTNCPLTPQIINFEKQTRSNKLLKLFQA